MNKNIRIVSYENKGSIISIIFDEDAELNIDMNAPYLKQITQIEDINYNALQSEYVSYIIQKWIEFSRTTLGIDHFVNIKKACCNVFSNRNHHNIYFTIKYLSL
jgi:hypothetical protein